MSRSASANGGGLSDLPTFISNYEVTVAYAARPGQAVRQHNLHLLLEFFLGLYDWTHIPISKRRCLASVGLLVQTDTTFYQKSGHRSKAFRRPRAFASNLFLRLPSSET